MNELPPDPRDDLIRIPGLFRRWELAQLIQAGEDYRIEDAGTTSDGTPLFAVYTTVLSTLAADELGAAR